MSGGSAWSIRRHSVELWQDLVLHGIGKSTFQHLTVDWNFNVLEMAFKTLHFVPGLSGEFSVFFTKWTTIGTPKKRFTAPQKVRFRFRFRFSRLPGPLCS